MVALDGLRGIAALVVVFHHVYQIARPFLEPTTHAWAVGTLWWFISATPIKLLSAGSESVLVFFVLSGVVGAENQSHRGSAGTPFQRGRSDA
ncbi:MAG TPA: acyltransferase family protein [Galbitalea sp.]|jgi:peptidoglycan/LPS O-acetylase OafA/YrhL|nr:acyltransferase family protein [Galbitalea sp.]